jgi:hypothetical protein
MPPGQATYGILVSDYRTDHLQAEELAEPLTFFYAMDLGGGRFFMEERPPGAHSCRAGIAGSSFGS